MGGIPFAAYGCQRRQTFSTSPGTEGAPDGRRRLHSAITLPCNRRNCCSGIRPIHSSRGLRSTPPACRPGRLNVTSGDVSALAGLGDDPKRRRTTAPVPPGNRGGPLLAAAGNVVGVVVSKLDAVRTAELTGNIPQNADFTVKGALMRGFLDIHGVACRRRTSDAKLVPERLAERARASTVAAPCRE